MYKNYFKTLIDKILSLLGMVFLCPVFIVITFALLIDNKGKAFFTQDRPGKNGKIFKIIKDQNLKGKEKNEEVYFSSAYHSDVQFVLCFRRDADLPGFALC